jgi:hypothetical protein
MRRPLSFVAGLLLGIAAFLSIAATIVSGPIQFGPEFTVNAAGQIDVATAGIAVGQSAQIAGLVIGSAP